jgi:REP element-mobilizing transposase RayT
MHHLMMLGYKSNNNVVYSSKYHVIWCPKYRRKVLVAVPAVRELIENTQSLCICLCRDPRLARSRRPSGSISAVS